VVKSQKLDAHDESLVHTLPSTSGDRQIDSSNEQARPPPQTKKQ